MQYFRNFSIEIHLKIHLTLRKQQRICLSILTLPTKEEIERALKQQKSEKASGPDEIPVEALKVDLIGSTNMFYDLFQDIWNQYRKSGKKDIS